MSLLSRLFGGGGGSAPEPQTYQGFNIFPEPIKEGSDFRVAARIEKEVDGELQTHQLIRADTCGSDEQAQDLAVLKAKQLIDQQGDRLFT